MTEKRIDGKAFAARLRERIGERAAEFAAKAGRKPGLAVVLVGGDPARRTLCAVLREGATLDDQFQAAIHAGYVRLPSLDCWLPSAHRVCRVRVQIRATHVASGGRWGDDSG